MLQVGLDGIRLRLRCLNDAFEDFAFGDRGWPCPWIAASGRYSVSLLLCTSMSRADRGDSFVGLLTTQLLTSEEFSTEATTNLERKSDPLCCRRKRTLVQCFPGAMATSSCSWAWQGTTTQRRSVMKPTSPINVSQELALQVFPTGIAELCGWEGE